MVGPLLAHALVAPAVLAMTGATPAALRRYTVARTGLGGAGKTLAEERQPNVVKTGAEEAVRQGLAVGETLYLATAAEMGAAPENVTSWTLSVANGPEWPVVRLIDYSAIYKGIVVQSGGAP